MEFLSLSIRQIRFEFNGFWVVICYFVQILKIHSTSKQCSTRSDSIDPNLGLFYQTQAGQFSDSQGISEEIFQVKRLCTYVPVHHELIYHVAEVILA